MCDNNDDDDLPKSIKKLNLKDEKCKKCQGENGKAAILLRNDDKPLCKECFLVACTHKFRQEFGKTQIVRQGEQVLVGFSGGPSSYAMLQLIKQGLSESQFRKLRFNPIFVHIIENKESKDEIENALKNSGFRYLLKSLEDLNDSRISDINNNILQNPKSATCLSAAKSIVLKDILTKIAISYDCCRVLLASNCTRLSQRVLSNIAQGSGAACAVDVSFHDTRYRDMSIIQPMRGFSMKEISFLNTFSNINFIFSSNHESGKSKTYSIDRLTEDFLSSLTPSFPSTIFTISKTAEKMTYLDIDDQVNKCTFCGNLFKDDSEDLSVCNAANSLKFSYSLLTPVNLESPNKSVSNEDKNLCFSCRIIQEEVNIKLII